MNRKNSKIQGLTLSLTLSALTAREAATEDFEQERAEKTEEEKLCPKWAGSVDGTATLGIGH
jgi:hypothetical protein